MHTQFNSIYIERNLEPHIHNKCWDAQSLWRKQGWDNKPLVERIQNSDFSVPLGQSGTGKTMATWDFQAFSVAYFFIFWNPEPTFTLSNIREKQTQAAVLWHISSGPNQQRNIGKCQKYDRCVNKWYMNAVISAGTACCTIKIYALCITIIYFWLKLGDQICSFLS